MRKIVLRKVLSQCVLLYYYAVLFWSGDFDMFSQVNVTEDKHQLSVTTVQVRGLASVSSRYIHCYIVLSSLDLDHPDYYGDVEHQPSDPDSPGTRSETQTRCVWSGHTLVHNY